MSFIEWFDFLIFIYIFIAFFKSQNDSSILNAFQQLGIIISFIARPIGAYVLGLVSLKIGRITSLLYTVKLMMVASFLLIVAAYMTDHLILCATIAFIARFIQGFSIGSETSSNYMYIYEISKKKATGVAIAGVGVACGQVLASFAPNLLNGIGSFQDKILWAYGSSILLSFVVLYLRKSMPETKDPRYQNIKQKVSVFKITHEILKAVFPFGFLIYYVLIIFPKHAEQHYGISKEFSYYYLTYACLIIAFLPLLFASIADKIGTSKVLTLAIYMTVLFIPLFLLIKDPFFQITYIAALNSIHFSVALVRVFNDVGTEQLYLHFPLIYNVIMAALSSFIVAFFNSGLEHDHVFLMFLFGIIALHYKHLFFFLFNPKKAQSKIYGS
ncbi:hypothetical protein AXG55_08120 [Silvanigrella aquatica]|uniref:Major facilitator superfamily (MFS) profile domain-containing protein n=2 Tax=Silvanigrella aquatica TaxID=1915309 RepID=A0A1L4D107_9BACT|nr:hypothetical protein AXG55_08120 [Silvanigrella aquatica]